MCIGRLQQQLRNGFLFSCWITVGQSASQDKPYVFQTCLCLNWDGLFWEGVFSALLPRDGLWSAQGLMLRGTVPKQPCQGKLAKRCRPSSTGLGKGGNSRLFIPTQPPQGNSNEFALIYKTKNHFLLFKREEQRLPRIRFPSSQIQTSLTAAMEIFLAVAYTRWPFCLLPGGVWPTWSDLWRIRRIVRWDRTHRWFGLVSQVG